MRVRRKVLASPLAGLEPAFRAIREQGGVREGYAADVYFEAEHGGRGEEGPHIPDERADATDLPFVTVDPEGSLDLDQALHLERRGSGHRVHYAIADVASHVAPGGPLDRDTRERVETVYCPDRRVGLHPPVMSEGYASLLPGQRTRAVLWTLDLDADGDLAAASVRRVWVRSRRQLSYAGLEHSPPDDARELVALLREVGGRRRALARRRGAVTLPKPEQEALVEDGAVRVVFRAPTMIEGDNAQISLLTGEAAARMMLDAGVGVLRTMPPADDRSVRRLRHQARALGVEWPEEESYGDFLDRIHPGSPETAAFLSEATSLFRGASWEPFDDADPALPRPAVLTHGALGVPYAHVTAPLRRLVDRFGTEICLAHAAGRLIPEWVREALPTLGSAMARGTHVARQVDRRCVDAVEAAVLAPHVGEVFEGVGLDERTVQLAEPAVVARCEGGVAPGRRQRVRLESADPERGPLFSVGAA